MKERLYLISLYDCYGDLLTSKQSNYFEDYYYNNLSLAEISENNNVSRSAVSKSLNEIANKLNNYEEKLRMHYKYTQISLLNINEKEKKQILNILEG